MKRRTNFQKVDQLIDKFDRYLHQTKGLSPNTIQSYRSHVRVFLTFFSKNNEICIDHIHAQDVIDFIISYTHRGALSRAQHMTYPLRAFFRFLKQTKGLKEDLTGSVPSVANRKQITVPASLSAQELKRLLSSCNKNSIKGLRDYTVLMLLTQLGLRASEVCNLTLDDLDWDNSEIIISGKGSIKSRFPIFQNLGDALVDYLRDCRPACLDRHLLLSVNKPSPIQPHTVSKIVRDALRNANLNPSRKGAHLLRHTFAVQLLNNGASLQEIAIVLRHRDINTTAIYAKVDFVKLKMLSLPWPHNFKDGGLL
jgi:integrase/recombinase XerD